MPKFLSRYLDGDCHKVWQELRNLGEIDNPIVAEDALNVERENDAASVEKSRSHCRFSRSICLFV